MIILRKQKNFSILENKSLASAVISASITGFSKLLFKLAHLNVSLKKPLSNNITCDKIESYIKQNHSDLLIYRTTNMGSCYIPITKIADKDIFGNEEFKLNSIRGKKNHILTVDDAIKDARNKNKDLIVLNYNDGPVVIAHELGHYLDINPKSLTHWKINQCINNKITKPMAAFVAWLLGYTGPIGALLAPLTQIIIRYPALHKELIASYYGIQILKKLGATNEDLKQVRHLLTSAFMTYFTHEITAAGLGGLAGAGFKASIELTKKIDKKV